MIANISTTLESTDENLWEVITKPKSLLYVCSPVLSFTLKEPGILDSRWEVRKKYAFKIRLFKIVPLGSHTIEILSIDKENNTIVSNESGTMASVWNHTITFSMTDQNSLNYLDQIEIKAGLLTFSVWAFSHMFYRHRQRRWKKLLKNERLKKA